MQVIIRTDSSSLIGTGHLMRCLTLARILRRTGATVSFICRDLAGNNALMARQAGFRLSLLPRRRYSRPGPEPMLPHASWLGTSWQSDLRETLALLRKKRVDDWLIVDHYALDCRWEEPMRSRFSRILVIDDIGDRDHDCDILLDHNLHCHPQALYKGRVPKTCRLFLGPQYALLRDEFNRARQRKISRDGRVRRLLISFGGVDDRNETLKAVEAVKMLAGKLQRCDLIIGPANPNRRILEQACRGHSVFRVHRYVRQMARMMLPADLALGGGGTTTWERCALGLPTIAIEQASNQHDSLQILATRGALWNLGPGESVSAEAIHRKLSWAISHPEAVFRMGHRAAEVIGDIEQGTHPTVTAMWESLNA